MGEVKYFGELVGQHFEGSHGGSKNLLGYSTSKICINIMAQPRDGGRGGEDFHIIQEWAAKPFYTFIGAVQIFS